MYICKNNCFGNQILLDHKMENCLEKPQQSEKPQMFKSRKVKRIKTLVKQIKVKQRDKLNMYICVGM